MTRSEPSPAPTPANILVVDDEPMIRQLLEDWLSEQPGVTVYTAAGVADARVILKSKTLDLLLVDLFLGEGSGLEIIQEAAIHQPHAVAILVTAHPTVETAITALQSGTFDYLIKPFRLDMLSAAINRALEHCRLRRENMQLREQVAVLELNRAVGAMPDTESMLGLVTETVAKECAASAVSVVLRSSETGRLELSGFHGDRAMLEDPQRSRFLRGEGVTAASVIARGQCVVMNDATHESSVPEDGCERICQPLIVKEEIIGLLNIIRRSGAATSGEGTMRTIEMIAHRAAVAIDNARLYKDLQATYIETVTALANAIEIRDPHTHGHTDRVKVLARAIGAKLGWDSKRLAILWMGCTLHDIGKIGVPDAILSKPGPLTPDEFAVMKTHPAIGAKMIEGVPFLKDAVPYIFYHHERYNGTGYPTGLSGEDIPIEGRLLAVVDAFDAITSDRPYRKGQTIAAACEELRVFSGIQFDPQIVDVFLSILDSSDFPWIMPRRSHEDAAASPASLA